MASGGGPSSSETALRWRARLGEAWRRLARRSPATVRQPDEAGIRLAFVDPVEDAKPRVLVGLLGVAPEDLPPLVETALAAIDRRREVPVFLVSTLVFDLFRTRELLFEHLPDRATAGFADEATWRHYVERKHELIRAKWQPSSEMDLGRTLVEFLE